MSVVKKHAIWLALVVTGGSILSLSPYLLAGSKGIQIKTGVIPSRILPGGRGEITILIIPDKGIYIGGERNPTVIEFKPPQGIILDKKKIIGDRKEHKRRVKFLVNFRLKGQLPTGTYQLKARAMIFYCSDIMCVQSTEQLSIPIIVSEEGTSLLPREKEWSTLLLTVVFIFTSGILCLGYLFTKQKTFFFLSLTCLAGWLILMGIRLEQLEFCQSVASEVCLSCIGLEETRGEETVTLSPETVQKLKGLSLPVKIYVFSSRLCKTCPYAKEMVKRMKEINPSMISYVLIDNQQGDYRIYKNKYNIWAFPTIVIEGKREIIVGTGNLEKRLLHLIGK